VGLIHATVHDHDDRAGAVVPDGSRLTGLDPGTALDEEPTPRPILDDASDHAAEGLKHAKAVGAHAQGHRGHGAVELPDDVMRDPAQARAHEGLGGGDLTALRVRVLGRELSRLGKERRVELYQDAHGSLLRGLRVQLRRHQRPLLGSTTRHQRERQER